MKINKLGMRVLSYFYLCLVFFYVLPLFIFSTQLLIFGKIISSFLSKSIHGLFMVFFYFLYWALARVSKTGLRMAAILHTVFLVNSFFILSGKTPILEIRGMRSGPYSGESLTIILNIIINISIIAYVVYQYRYFVDNS